MFPETECIEQFFAAFGYFPSFHTVDSAENPQILNGRQHRVEGKTLRYNANQVFYFVDFRNGVEPANADGARVGLAQSAHYVHQRCFSGAVRSQQTKAVTFVNIQRQVVERRLPVVFVGLAESVYFDDCRHYTALFSWVKKSRSRI